MSQLESTPEDYCRHLLGLSATERYVILKALNSNDLFCAIMSLLPDRMRDEFWWFAKRERVASILKYQVDNDEIAKLTEREVGGHWPVSISSLLERLSQDDELWRFEEFPGDKGYAIVRKGCVIDFSITEVNSVTIS